VLGVANVRGELLVCVSLQAILHLREDVPVGTSKTNSAPQSLLVVGWPEGAVAMPIHEAQGVNRFHEQDLKQVPATVAKAEATYTRAVLPLGKRMVGLLDTDLLCHTIGRSLA